MCKPISKGGKRCASHTRKPAMDAYRILLWNTEATDQEMSVLADYASTPTGAKHMAELRNRLPSDKAHTKAILGVAIKQGRVLAAAHKETAELIKQGINPALPPAPKGAKPKTPAAPKAERDYAAARAACGGDPVKIACYLINETEDRFGSSDKDRHGAIQRMLEDLDGHREFFQHRDGHNRGDASAYRESFEEEFEFLGYSRSTAATYARRLMHDNYSRDLGFS